MRKSLVVWVMSALGCAFGGFAACSVSDGTSKLSGSGSGQVTAGGGNDLSVGAGIGGMCGTDPGSDYDLDGFTGAQGDCDDCNPGVNPGAVEVIGMGGSGNPVDEDCDGTVDNPPQPCDSGLALESTDAMDGARAMELCKQAGASDWGVISAAYVRADGTQGGSPLQYGILANFGPNVPPQNGSNMLGLSSGHARIPGQPGECGQCSCTENGPGTPPPGFPQNAPGCVLDQTINDDVGLEVRLRAPSNASGYTFDFKFYTFEFAEWVCTNFNDQFMALVTPPPAGAIDGNVSFDMNNNPVSVNIAFFDTCTSCADWAVECLSGCPPQPNPCCPDGPAEMAGTGFDNWTGVADNGEAGGTAWLRTTVPVMPKEEFTIRFAIWDTGDELLDSTAVVDNFQWIGGAVTVGTQPVPE